MRTWKKSTLGDFTLMLGDQAVAYVSGSENKWTAWSMLTRGNEAIFTNKDHDSLAEAKAYAERQVDLWLVRAELREV